jgi:hypothetical protein
MFSKKSLNSSLTRQSAVAFATSSEIDRKSVSFMIMEDKIMVCKQNSERKRYVEDDSSLLGARELVKPHVLFPPTQRMSRVGRVGIKFWSISAY